MNTKPMIIAEIANSHEGSVQKLTKLVDSAIKAKPDAIKVHILNPNELLVPNHPDFKLFQSLIISNFNWKKIFDKIKKHKIKIYTDVFSTNTAKAAIKFGTDGFKIHSSDITNEELLKFIGKTKKPILLSCAGSNLNEINNAIEILKKSSKGTNITLMHGFQGFPTHINDINLQRMKSFQDFFGLDVGYSDHVSGDSPLASYLPLIALGLGAVVIEKHITSDRSLKETDYQSALNPDEFFNFVSIIRKSFKSLGSKSFDMPTSESKYRHLVKKFPVSKINLDKNYKVQKQDILLRRIINSTNTVKFNQIIRSTTRNKIKKFETFSNNNIKQIKPYVVAVLACRVNSSRLFAKPLQKIGKHTILELLLIQLQKSKLIDDVVLAISENKGNEIFVDFAKQNSIKYVLGDDVDVQARMIKAANYQNADIIFRITTENPFIYWDIIDSVINFHIKNKSDFTYVPKLPLGCGFELINTNSLKLAHKMGNKRTRSELVTEYIYRHKNKFKITYFEVDNFYQHPELRLTVDNPEDLILVRKIFSKLKQKNIPKFKEVITILKENPELIKINQKFSDTSNRTWL